MVRLASAWLALALLLSARGVYAWMPCNPIWSDEFAYGQPTRALNGNGGWSGSATTEIEAWDNWCCNIIGGAGDVDACKTGLNYYGNNNVVWVQTYILGFNDNPNTMWNIWIDDELGRNHACLYGSDNWLAGKSGSSVTPQCSLIDRGFHDIDIKIDTAAHTADFYADNTWLGQLSYPNGQDSRVDRVRFERIDNSAAAGAYLLIGSMSMGEGDITPPSIPGTPYRSSGCDQSTSITFNWRASSDPCSGVASYHIQVGTSPGAGNMADTWIGNTSYTFTGAVGTTYYCRVCAKDIAGNQSGWSATGSSATVMSPPVMQVDGKPFFPIGYYAGGCPGSVTDARDYLATQHSQGMNMALSCYSIWGCGDFYMKNVLEGGALADMKVAMEVNRYAVRGDPGYPTSLIDDQVILLKNYPNMLGWYLMDEPEAQGIPVTTLQPRYAQVKADDPNHSIWVVHVGDAQFAGAFLAAEPPPYTDVLMTDWYPVNYGSPEFGGALWMVAKATKYQAGLAMSYGKQACLNVVQAQGWQDFNTRLPTYAEQRYLSYAPVTCGARGLLFWMYEAFATPEYQQNVVGPVAREISSLIPAIVSNSKVVCVTSNRDTDTTGHSVGDVTYVFGEDSHGGYLIAANNTASTLSVTFQLAGDVLARQFATQNASIPVISESRNVTVQPAGDPTSRTLTDTFTPYDVNIYRIYTLDSMVSIDLGTTGMADGMTHPQNSDGDTVVVENMAGVNCKRNSDPGASPPDSFFYFGVSDSLAFQGNNSDMYITVRYYDSASGSLELQYDATESAFKSGGSIALAGSNTWKDQTFHVTDAYFGNRQNGGADFRISGSAGLSFYLDTVRVVPNAYVTSDKPNGAYKAGEDIRLQATFRTPVYVTGVPQLELETGGVDRRASYLSGSGTNTLTFDYVVQSADTSPDLDCTSTGALILNGGSIKDAGGLDIDLTLPSPGAGGSLGRNKSLAIDANAPSVLNITSTRSDGPCKIGDAVSIQVAFSEPVNVVGVPRLELETGTTDRKASYVSGSGTSTLSFSYTVQTGDVSPHLDCTGTGALALNGGTIRDPTLNDATLILPSPGSPGSLGANKNIVIDGVRPAVVNVTSDKPDGSYKAGENIDISVTFTEPMVATGTPLLELETGAVDQKASYISGSGTSVLVFRYSVQSGDTSSDLSYKATNSLTGTIKDVAGNTGSTTLPALGSANSLSGSKALVIDTTAPSTTASPVSGVYGSPREITLTASEAGETYYTVDGSEPTTASLCYAAPIPVSADTVLRFYAVDTAGNEESPKKQETYKILSEAGSIAAVEGFDDGAPVRLGNKALYLKRAGLGYIEESSRASGIRIEGGISANEGDLVCLTGTLHKLSGEERCVVLDMLTPSGPGSVRPLGMPNQALETSMSCGLYVRAWGVVLPGSVTANSYVITDGSDATGVKVITPSAPSVSVGQFVTVTGAAGFDGARVIYSQ